MSTKQELEEAVLHGAAEYGISITMFRNALAKRLRLTLTESLCLTALGIGRVRTPTEIARFTGLTTGATTSMLDRLERRRFVRRVPNPDDRRGVIVETDEGYTEHATDLISGIQKDHRRHVACFSETELKVVERFLRGFNENLVRNARHIEEKPVESCARS